MLKSEEHIANLKGAFLAILRTHALQQVCIWTHRFIDKMLSEIWIFITLFFLLDNVRHMTKCLVIHSLE